MAHRHTIFPKWKLKEQQQSKKKKKQLRALCLIKRPSVPRAIVPGAVNNSAKSRPPSTRQLGQDQPNQLSVMRCDVYGGVWAVVGALPLYRIGTNNPVEEEVVVQLDMACHCIHPSTNIPVTINNLILGRN